MDFFFFATPKIICQVCGRVGHNALQYYYKFDITYIWELTKPQFLVF